jgi:hypothetical protein
MQGFVPQLHETGMGYEVRGVGLSRQGLEISHSKVAVFAERNGRFSISEEGEHGFVLNYHR